MEQNEQNFERPLVSLEKFLREIGRSRTTGYRWRKLGLLQTVDICGRQYLTREALAEFQKRAEAGEFALFSKSKVAR